MSVALITGASSGIGLALAELFAADGSDLVLVARSEDKLRETAGRLSAAYSVEATPMPLDLSDFASAEQLRERLDAASLTIDTLVNNAGFEALGEFAELDEDRQARMVMVNVVAVTRLTRMLLPSMIARNRGGVLNVGSIAGYQAGPYMAVYYATKAYVLSFTEGLREELRDTNVHVTLLAPGATQTQFGEDSGMGSLDMFQSMSMPVSEVADAGYRGYRDNQDVVVPGWKNRLMATSTSILPRFVTRKLVGRLQDAGEG